MKLFSIYDSKAEAHVLWMTNENENTMQREISSRYAESMLAKTPEDYTLFEIALLDERSGKLIPHDAMVSICNLTALFNRVPNDGHPDQISAVQ